MSNEGCVDLPEEMYVDIANMFNIPVNELNIVNMVDHAYSNLDIEENDESPTKPAFDPKVKFSYYGNTSECSNHNGIATIASVVDDENEIVSYGVSYCSPKDVYNKHLGKILAVNNLEIDNNIVELKGKKHHKINARILGDIIANAECPSWAERMIADNLVYHLFHAYNLGEC